MSIPPGNYPSSIPPQSNQPEMTQKTKKEVSDEKRSGVPQLASKVETLVKHFGTMTLTQTPLQKAQETEPAISKMIQTGRQTSQPEGQLKRVKQAKEKESESESERVIVKQGVAPHFPTTQGVLRPTRPTKTTEKSEPHVIIEHGIEPQFSTQGVLRPASIESAATKTVETTVAKVVQLPESIQHKINANKEDLIYLKNLQKDITYFKEELKIQLQNKDLINKIEDKDLSECLDWIEIKKNSIKNTKDLLFQLSKDNDKFNNITEAQIKELNNMEKEYKEVNKLIEEVRETRKKSLTRLAKLDQVQENKPVMSAAIAAPQNVMRQKTLESNEDTHKTSPPKENYAYNSRVRNIKKKQANKKMQKNQ